MRKRSKDSLYYREDKVKEFDPVSLSPTQLEDLVSKSSMRDSIAADQQQPHHNSNNLQHENILSI